MISKEEIKKTDKEDMLGSIATLGKQAKEGFRLSQGIKAENVNEVIIAGMGGSALPGEIIKSVSCGSKLRLALSKDYSLPGWANSKTLVFAVSYSGNTEETISAYKEAYKKGCRIIAVTSGGKLEQMAKQNNTRLIKVPKPFEMFQPRTAIGYMTFAILGVLENSRMIEPVSGDLEKIGRVLDEQKYLENAENLAEELKGSIPVIYASEKLYAAAYIWKIAFNENAKIHAFCSTYPEQNHNEINAFEKMNAKFHVIMLSNDDDHPQIRKRMRITKELFRKKGADVTEIAVKGESIAVKIFSAIMAGLLTAYFLAIKQGMDPTPAPMVEELKKQL